MASLIGRILSSLPKTPFLSPTNRITCRFGAENPHFQPKITPPPPPPPMTCKFIPPPTNSFYKGAKRAWFLMACTGTIAYLKNLLDENEPITLDLMVEVGESIFFFKRKTKDDLAMIKGLLLAVLDEVKDKKDGSASGSA